MRNTRWIEIDTRALLSNAKVIRRHLGADCRLMGVLKADAYGHGADFIAETLALHKACDVFGVWSLEEAEKIQKKALPIGLLAPSFDDALKLEWGVRRGIWFCVDRKDLARKLAKSAQAAGRKAKVFLDIDFGLARWGVSFQEAASLAEWILGSSNLNLEGIFTHLDYVSGLQKTEGESKLRRFLEIANRIALRIGRPFIKSCANSSVFIDFPDWRLDMVRIGNLLYGVNPTRTPFSVKSIWSFKARVVNIRSLNRGAMIGYGSEYLVPRPMRVATVLCGFAEGLTMEPAHRFIRLSGPPKYYAKLGSKELPFIGRPGIGHVLLDAALVPQLKIGDVVELPVRRTAASARVPRIYR